MKEENNLLRKVGKKDHFRVPDRYFEDFSSWMESADRLREFDFDINDINEGDYVKIKTKEGQKIANGKYEKYDNYSVYFFDIETLTLYYIHNNI